MTHKSCITEECILVAIDVAKGRNAVLVRLPDGSRHKFQVANSSDDYHRFGRYLHSFGWPCRVGLEATGNYHRPLAYFLLSEGFEVRLVSSLAAARTREAMYNSWDKNDPKDAQVILHMLEANLTQTYCEPFCHGFNDYLEISQTHYQVSLRKTRVQHSILTHFLPLYFPEAQRFFHVSRAAWFSAMLLRFPVPAAITRYSEDEFIKEAWHLAGRKVNKRGLLSEFFHAASGSIGVPVSEDSLAVESFRIVLQEHQDLCRLRTVLEKMAEGHLEGNQDYQRLRTIPGIGPIVALTILAEAGDLRRFSHHRQFLAFCGFNLSTLQSGQFKGTSRLSKHGNARLRYAFWLAACTAIRMRENTFRKKYDNYVTTDPSNADLKRKAFSAVAAKVARVAHALIANNTDYRCYYESQIPGGRIPSKGRRGI